MLTFLKRGVLAGVVGGLLAGAFGFLLAEPVMDRAVDLDTARQAAAGEHVQFTVWNEAMGGWLARLLFIFVGAAALKLGVTPGPPPQARPAP